MKEKQKINNQKRAPEKNAEPNKRTTYMNEDGAMFFTDTDDLVPGSVWDYPGSPYSSDYDEYD